MKESVPVKIASSYVDNRILSIQSHILNNALIVLLLTSIIGISLSLSRTIHEGFHIVNAVQFSHLTVNAVAVVFRNSISYRFRFSILIGILILLALFGMYNYGLIGNGVMFLIVASVLASAFISQRSSIVTLGLSAIIVIVFMYLFVSGRISLSFDQNSYVKMYTPWMGVLVIFIMFTGMLIAVTSGLFKNMKNLIIDSNHHLNEIEELNATLEEKVRVRTEELSLLNKDKDRILGIVAHDINNKLGGIIGYLDLLKDEDPQLNPQKRLQFTNKALESSMMAAEIVKELLELSRHQTETKTLSTERVEMADFIQSTVDCHTPQALEKNIELKASTSSTSTYCNINRSKFSRVLDNIITNAIKFTNTSGNVNINIEKSDAGYIVITVKDSGIGIPDEHQETIFKPFSRARRVGTANEESTGLGLSISREIVESHSGKIWFESEEGKGTTFYISLPAA